MKSMNSRDIVFDGLGGAFLSKAGTQIHTRLYGRKQCLFYEDSPTTGIYIVRSGTVKLYKVSAEGKQHILRIAQAGDIIGLEAALSSEAYPATAEVIEEGEISFLDKTTALAIIGNNPAVSMEVMKRLAAQVQSGDAERLDLAQSSVRERMARLLATLSSRHGISEKKGVRINLKLSREEMAEMIGTASETAMRLLKDFREESLVEVHGRDILVLDRNRLLRTANLAA